MTLCKVIRSREIPTIIHGTSLSLLLLHLHLKYTIRSVYFVGVRFVGRVIVRVLSGACIWKENSIDNQPLIGGKLIIIHPVSIYHFPVIQFSTITGHVNSIIILIIISTTFEQQLTSEMR